MYKSLSLSLSLPAGLTSIFRRRHHHPSSHGMPG
jgi:hypothetical protein